MLRRIALLAGILSWMPAAAAADSVKPVRVTIHDHAFSPRVIHVKVGQAIIWLNTDEDPHTVTSGTGGTGDDRWASSPLIPDGKTFTLHITKRGNYPYFCKPHQFEEAMHGTIIVSQ